MFFVISYTLPHEKSCKKIKFRPLSEKRGGMLRASRLFSNQAILQV